MLIFTPAADYIERKAHPLSLLYFTFPYQKCNITRTQNFTSTHLFFVIFKRNIDLFNMGVHFALIGRVLEQTGSSRQKSLLFQYFDRQMSLETLDMQYFETDESRMRSDGTYLVQGTASLREGAKPNVNICAIPI